MGLPGASEARASAPSEPTQEFCPTGSPHPLPAKKSSGTRLSGEGPTTAHASPPRPGALSESPLTPRSGVSEDAVGPLGGRGVVRESPRLCHDFRLRVGGAPLVFLEGRAI